MNQPGHRVPQILYEDDDEDDDLICHEILDDEETPVVPLGGVGRGGGTPLPPP